MKGPLLSYGLALSSVWALEGFWLQSSIVLCVDGSTACVTTSLLASPCLSSLSGKQDDSEISVWSLNFGG
jgi:hypothetical protein